jgi:HrpA-like RNA helicase
VCCQPRKIAAVSLAQQVAKELGCGGQLGGLVGYRVGADSRVSPETRILFVTEQVLVNEAVKDRSLAAYACLVLDEVHERSVNTDILLGLAKGLIAERKDFRVVIASATMDSGIFHDFFRQAAQELRIPGRTYPIEIFYSEGDVCATPAAYMKAALAQTQNILDTTEEGDILVFLATPADTDSQANALRAKNPEVLSLQLHGRLDVEEQRRVFQPSEKRKVVFATNCAETSITVPGSVQVAHPIWQLAHSNLDV